MKYHFTHTSMAKIINKRQIITSIDENVEKLEPSYISFGNVKWYNPFRRQFCQFLEKLNIELLSDLARNIE